MIIAIGALLLSVPLSKKIYWKYSAIIFILISATYFFYTPPSQDDLYRHYLLLDEIRDYSINIFDGSIAYWNENPVYVMLLKIVSLFQQDAFLPFFVGIVYYLTSLYGIYLSSFKNNVSQREILSVIILLITTNYINIAGIRNILGASIFLLGIYMDLIKRKRIGLFFYIMAALIHSVTIFYIIVRFLVSICRGRKKIFIFCVSLFIPLMLTNFSAILYSIFSSIPLLSSIIVRFQIYTIENMGMEISTNWRLVTTLEYLFIFALAFSYEELAETNEKFKGLYHFLIILLLSTIGFFNQRELYNRHTILLLPIGVMYFTLLKNKVFVRFPFMIKEVNHSVIAKTAPFLCISYVCWSIIYYLILAIYTYPMSDGNFMIL